MATQNDYNDQVTVRLRGAAVFPSLTVPETRFKALGVYKIGVAMLPDSDQAAELASKIDKMITDRIAYEVSGVKQKGLAPKREKAALDALYPTDDRCYKLELNKDGEETGRWVINAKCNAAYLDKKTGKKKILPPPVVVDSKRNPVTEEVWGGSEVVVNATLSSFATSIGVGVSCRLNGVQVLKLSAGRGNNPTSMFDEEEGYVASAAAKEERSDADDEEATEEEMD